MNKNQKGGISPIVIIIAVSAVLIAGGVLAYPYVQPYIQKMVQKQEQPTDQTSEWKTYRNDEYGFEVKYPENSEVVESDTNHLQLNIPATKAGLNLIEKNFSVWNNSNNSSQCLNFVSSNLSNTILITVGNLTFQKITDNTGGTQTWARATSYYIKNDINCYIFSTRLAGDKYSSNPMPNLTDESLIFDQMISTFKFTK